MTSAMGQRNDEDEIIGKRDNTGKYLTQSVFLIALDSKSCEGGGIDNTLKILLY